MEKLSTCLALIEIVNSCNLACPTCYADSPRGTDEVDAVPLADLQRRIQGVIDRKGGIEILQLSGGEPTLHPQFFELLALVPRESRHRLRAAEHQRRPHRAGRRLSRRTRKTFRYGKFQLYLQFDGLAGSRAARCAARICARCGGAPSSAAAR